MVQFKMKKFNKIKLLIGLLSVICTNGFAQNALYTKAQLQAIDATLEELKSQSVLRQKRIDAFVKKQKKSLRQIMPNGQVFEIEDIDNNGQAIYKTTYNNIDAAKTTNTQQLHAGGSLGLDLTGSYGRINGKLGIWDGGKVLDTHVEFSSRLTQQDNATTLSSHATHVSGTMIGEGINKLAKGMAFGAQLKAWDFSNDQTEMNTASKDLLISNHSYGTVAGWSYNENRTTAQKWEWHGSLNVSADEDFKLGYYDQTAAAWDRIMYNAPYYLIVKSAGNKRSETGPATLANDPNTTVERYFLGSSNDSSRVARSKNNGYDILPTYSCAKNILTVGAISIVANGVKSANDIKISSFSSWGPTDDGRIKPDIVGAGVNLQSSISSGPSNYGFLSGTSMSSPQVSASLFLLQELFAKRNADNLLISSALKGLACHTAIDAGRPGPDYIYGWGLLNAEEAANVIINKNNQYILETNNLANNGTYTKKVIAKGTEPLKVTICWTDPEGPAIGNITKDILDNPTPMLVNDLDLTITDTNNKTYQAWVMNPANPDQDAGTGNNRLDNIEQVYIPNTVPGKEYTITIKHKGTLKNNVQQYALLGSGIGGVNYCTSAPLSNQNTKINNIKIENIDYKSDANCTSYTDKTDQTIKLVPGKPTNINFQLGTCKDTKTTNFGVYVDLNLDGDFNDENENILLEKNVPTSSLSRTVTLPINLPKGLNSIMRCVASEDADNKPCGNYSAGETIDFLLNTIYPQNDLSVGNLIYPNPNNCEADTLTNVTIELENNGSTTAPSANIAVNIFEDNVAIVKALVNKNINLLGQTNASVVLPINQMILKKDKTYTYNFSIQNADEIPLNNSKEVKSTIKSSAKTTQPQVISCTGSNISTLSSGNSDPTFWYDAATNGKLLGAGSKFQINNTALPAQVFAIQNNLKARNIGVKTKYALGGGTYAGNFGPKVLVSTKVPIKIESARMYIGNNGRLKFIVEKLPSLEVVSTSTVEVTSFRNPSLGTASSGQLVDDPNDPGAVYNINLEIPAAGDYQIGIEYLDGASIYRSNVNIPTNLFPINVQNLVTFKGASFNGSTLTTAYYYFYDIKLKSLGCTSPEAVLATKTSLTSSEAIISAPKNTICKGEKVNILGANTAGLNFEWYKDSVLLADAKTNTIAASESGNYFAVISNNGSCPSKSNTVKLTLKTPSPASISSLGNQITASEADSYVWYYNKKPLVGATSRVLSAYQTGYYYVVTKTDGCEIASPEIYVTILADEKPKQGGLSLWPNPTANMVNLSFEPGSKPKKVTIFDSKGIVKASFEVKANQNNASLEIGDWAMGLYFVAIETDNKKQMAKFVKSEK